MPAEHMRVIHADQEPDYRELISHVSESVWPEFMHHGRVANEYWDALFERFASFQFALLDPATETAVAIANSVPLAWTGDPAELPEGGWDWAMVQSNLDHEHGIPPRTLCGMQISVVPAFQGKGLSRRMLNFMRDLARDKGLSSLVVPVRPSLKANYPLTSIDRYIEWETGEGLPLDPWLRVHVRAGGRIVKACHDAMIVTGTIADWESWTGMRFPDSGRYVIPGALIPIEADLANDEARYVEPNVWVHHQP